MKHLPKEILDCSRGRPRGERPSLAEFATCWYLIWISKKYGLETRKFFTLFLDAWMRGKSSCKNVSIECRQKTETDGVFLVLQDQDVVAQLRISEMALNRMPNVDLASFPWSEITFVEKVEKYGIADLQIKDVDVSTKWVNLKARVVEKSATRTVYSRVGGSYTLSTATISDDTGSVQLPLWDAQIDLVSVGDMVRIENGRVKSFRGALQVTIGKKSKLNVIETAV